MSIHDHKPLVTVKSVHADGDLALYTNGYANRVHLDLGDDIVTTSDTDLAPLAKAILNAVEPEALVENQKDAARDLAAEVDTLKVTIETIRTSLDAVRQAAAQAQTTATTANDKADRAYDRIAALEAAADTEIRVGDTVRVEPADWNIGGAWAGHETLTGEVIWVAYSGYTGPSKYLVCATPSRGENAGVTHSIYALKATKVVSRG